MRMIYDKKNDKKWEKWKKRMSERTSIKWK